MNNVFVCKSLKLSFLNCFLLLLTAFSTSYNYAQTQKGTISGIVKDTEGKPVEYTLVALKKGNKSSYTDNNGKFILKNVPVGNVVIVVQGLGYTTSETNVEVISGETTTIPDIVLSEDVNQLEEVNIFSSQNKFARKETQSVARLPIKNLENPQVYNVVGKDLMMEQVVLERTDVYRNVPGGVPNYSAGGSQGLTMRGFSNTSGMLNGLNTSPVYPMNTAILERIEFIKGPSGTLFGGNRNTSFGGVYNYVTKKPYQNFGGEIGYVGGSFNFSRVTADVNTPLNKEKTALLRLNVAGQSEGSFQDQGFAKNYVFAPSFSYQVTDRLKFSVDVDITRSNYTMTTISINKVTDITARNFKDLKLDYDRSYANNDVDSEIGVNNLGAQIDYKISDEWKSETKFLSSVGYYKHLLWTTLKIMTDETITRTVRNQTPETFGNTQLQQNFIGDFKIGSFRNRMLIGLDYNKNYNELNRVSIDYDTFNINDPVKDFNKEKINDLSYNSTSGFSTTTSKTENYGLYVSDVINLTPSLMAMISLRLDRFFTKGNYNVSTGIYAPNTGYQQTSLAPKFGLVYQPVIDKVSIFANYMNGFVNLAPQTQPDNTILKLETQYGTQWEVGVKVDVIKNKLIGSISYYDIAVTNSFYRDLSNYYVQDGTQNSKGVDIELIANPVPGLNIVAGYAYNENEYTNASTALEGKSLAASPKNVANIWASYTLTGGKSKGLGFGVGGNYVGDSWFEQTNTFVLPSYTLLNAALFYDQPRYRISLKGNNLLDEQYWNATGMPQKPINVLAGIAFKF